MNWRLSPEIAGITALVAADAASFLSGLNPSIFTIRAFAKSWAQADETRADILRGMAIGSALAIAVGIGGSLVTRSYWPLFGTLVTLSVLDATYAWAIANPRA